ncbi:MAG: N-acetylmuramoyl-L-alanine amidase [Alphaproteobacteria bacterium]
MPQMEIIQHPSPNFGDRRDGARISMLVMHYTGMKSGEESLARLCDPEAQVSAHYLIEEDGRVIQMVAEEKRAWHAGVAFWRGISDVNSHSIGIELQNPGHEHGYRAFPGEQISALIDLSRAILSRHDIPPAGIVGHSDIAPDRKTDPGELFPWRQMAAAGVGVFPDVGADTDEDLAALLDRIGYAPGVPGRIAAFQRRFRPSKVDDHADVDCARRAAAYLTLLNGKQ